MLMVNTEGKIKEEDRILFFSSLLTNCKKLWDKRKQGENLSVAHVKCFCH